MKILTRLAPIALALLANPVLAEVPENIARIDVLPGWRTADGHQMAALRISLAPGWKTYWRAPGDAGIPPIFDWHGSENLTGVAFHWPTPDVFDLNGMRTLGYHDSVVLPVEVAVQDGMAPARLKGTVEMGVCDEICVPVSIAFDAPLAPGAARDPEIVAALVDQPLTATEAGAGRVTCSTDPISDGLRISLSIDLAPTGGTEVVVIESGNDRIWTSEAAADRQGGRLLAVADMIAEDGKAFALDRSGIRVTVLGDNRAVDLRGCVGG